MKTTQTLAAAFGLVAMANAHMEMTSPAPFKSKHNPNAGQDIDYSMTSPLSQDGSNFPCKGYHTLLGTPAGAPTAEWQAGSSQSFTINGGANHGGGSCQASLSYDGGSTWSVIHSYIGNCPGAGESSFDFTIPSDAPSGEALFAWTWFNQIGNREMYMDCAAVTIAGGSSSKRALDGRPAMFVANVGNGCSTLEGTDLEFPDPGPDVSAVSSNTAPPSGSCPAGNSGGSPPADPPAAPSPSAPAPPVSSAAPPASPPATTEQPAAPPVVPTSVAGGVFLTVPPVEAPVIPTEAPEAPPVTLITSTRPAPAPVAPTSIVAPPSPEPTAPTTPPTTPPATPSTPPTAPPASGAGSFAPGEACTQEGLWNCVGGSQFQRCASGQWSPLIAMAAGTTCAEGQSDTLQTLRKRVYGQPLIRS